MTTALNKRVAAKLAGIRRRQWSHAAEQFTRSNTPELLQAYAAFAHSSQSGAPRQPFKGWDLWQHLERCQPRTIVEMGSGTTSAVFALWAKRNNATYICYEHHPEWAKVTEDCLRKTGLIAGESPVKVIASRVSPDGAATGFVEPIPLAADFIYVDGPPCTLETGTKVPNDDVTRLMDAMGRPRTIVVDGRLDTVDLIRKHASMKSYEFAPGYHYSLGRGSWADVLAGREHSVFTLSKA